MPPPCPTPWRNPRKGRYQILPSGNVVRGRFTFSNEGARDSVDKLADYDIVEEDDDDRGDLGSRVGIIFQKWPLSR